MPTWEEWSEDLRGVLDAAGSERAAIFAESEAGPTAILFAAMHPERVNALVLGNTTARYAAADDYPAGFSEEFIAGIMGTLEREWGSPLLIHAAFPSLAGDAAVVAALARLSRAAATPRMARALYGQIFTQLDLRHLLRLVHTPTLVLHNAAGYAEHARYIAAHIDGARVVEVPGPDVLFFAGDHDPVLDEVAEFLTGERPPVAIDRILTTVLFTDIVGSTERAAAVGDQQWRGLLDAHDRVVRTQLGHFRGQEISTTGDGFMARFDGHTGECEVRSGGVSGLAVHIAARVSALAGPGEVLVSRTVADLVSGSGIAFDDRGEHALKGVPGSWRPFAVRAVVAPLRRRAVGSRAP